MKPEKSPAEREFAIARVLRPLGDKSLSMAQAKVAAQLLGVHWTTVYRLRKRFLEDPVASSIVPKSAGPAAGGTRLDKRVDDVIDVVLSRWLPRQRELAHPRLDLTMEVRRRCRLAGLPAPSSSTIARRWNRHRDTEALSLAADPSAMVAPGQLVADTVLEIVQIDHTQADVFVVDERTRRPIGRPWLSVAIDVASRCVVGIYVAMERPNAAVVALLLTRVALPKAAWLASLGIDVQWPMSGIPKALHLDNAAEFKSRALRAGCSQYGIELIYRPVGRPHFGGHIERMNRTLMERLRGLPGATGNSSKGRKVRKPEEGAALTLREFEHWLVLEVAQRYHHSEHRGLMGATPNAAWQTLCRSVAPKQLPADPSQALRFLVQFLPLQSRTIQPDGLTLFYIRYWHPIFAAWRESRKKVVVRYHPEDLSRVFVTIDSKTYIEVRYADVRRPTISLWEQRHARRMLRSQAQRDVSEALIFRTIEEQRAIVSKAAGQAQAAKKKAGRRGKTTKVVPLPPWQSPPTGPSPDVDYSKPVEPYDAEIW
jgi:putative transposase